LNGQISDAFPKLMVICPTQFAKNMQKTNIIDSSVGGWFFDPKIVSKRAEVWKCFSPDMKLHQIM